MFDIQRFGSNDTVTSSCEGKLVLSFYDGDDRTETIYDPAEDITAAQINAVVDWMKEHQPVIGDKTGASLVGATSFKIVERTTRKLDLT